jgi:hypothetical protein
MNMGYFRKKPVEIEARQFESRSFDHMQELVHWVNVECGHTMAWHDGNAIHIHTLEGVHRADVGDWIIRGIAGEFYPCKPDIFSRTYDRLASP